VVVGVPSLLAGLGIWLMQRIVPAERRAANNEVAGYIFAMISGLYLLTLAFGVIVVWDTSEGAKTAVHDEASNLTELYWVGHALPSAKAQPIEQRLGDYLSVVTQTEWPLMNRHRVSDEATARLQDLRAELLRLQPANANEQTLVQQGLSFMTNAAEARQQRLDAVGEGMSPILWFALLLGGLLTVAFTFWFGLANTAWHVGMVVFLTVMVVFTLYLIHLLEFPFSGYVHVSPNDLTRVLDLVKGLR